MEQILDKIEVNFEQVIKCLPTPYLIFLANPPYFTLSGCSDSYLAITNSERSKILGQYLFDAFPPGTGIEGEKLKNDFLSSFERVMQLGKSDVMGVQRYDIPDKEDINTLQEKYWTVTNSPVFDKQGKVQYIIQRVEDITEYILLKRDLLDKNLNQDKSIWSNVEAEIVRSSHAVKAANRDIKESNEALERYKLTLMNHNEELKELDKLKTNFFSNVSHEFRTPLTLLLAPLEDLLNAKTINKQEQEKLEIAYRNALRLLKLVNTLLDFSRLEAGRAKATYRAHDISKLTAELASYFDSAVSKTGIKFIINCSPMPESIYLDTDFYEKILLNLISNAFKHTFDGEIEVSLRWVNVGVELLVRDTGIGIAQDQLPFIFERFHRVPNAKARTHEGSGIGLSLVQELVNLHQGNIKVKSELEKGTIFSIFLPKGKAHLPADQIASDCIETKVNTKKILEQDMEHWSTELIEESHDIEKCKIKAQIILADDNADMRNYIKKMLEPYYDVVLAMNGKEALAKAKEIKPDLILSDVMMPHMTGAELVNEIRNDENLRLTPIILLSARAGSEAKIEGLETGADDYLVKPFNAQELLVRIRTNLNMQKARALAQEALRQSEERYQLLYLWERITRETVQIFQKNLDMEETFSSAVLQLGMHLALERCYVVQFNEHGHVLPIAHEYRKNVQDKSYIGELPPYEIRAQLAPKSYLIGEKQICHQAQNGNTIVIQPIYYFDELLGTFVLYRQNKEIWTEQETFFLSTLCEQLKISLYQAKISAYMERAAKSKDQFISNMSHELRTPLNAIIGYSDMILKGMVNSAQTQHKFVGNIATAGRHLLLLINDILDLSKIEAGKFTLHIKQLTIKDFIDDVRTLLKELAASNQVFLDFHIHEIETIEADPVRLKQIMINLLNNAIKFNKQNGKVDVIIEKSDDNKWAIWKVIDTGIGIPQDKISELFTEFYQVDNSSARSYEGTGLGLALTKKLIHLHGGNISVQSKENVGSTFTFILPLEREIS